MGNILGCSARELDLRRPCCTPARPPKCNDLALFVDRQAIHNVSIVRDRSRNVKKQNVLAFRDRSRIIKTMAKKRKNPYAVALGRKGGKKGGPARAANMTAAERSESARNAVMARWAKRRIERDKQIDARQKSQD